MFETHLRTIIRTLGYRVIALGITALWTGRCCRYSFGLGDDAICI
jgi:hypothetical protein